MARRIAPYQAEVQHDDDPRVYQALALPDQALERGGTEILRLGVVEGELYVAVLPAFETPARWGEVMAEVARRLAAIYATGKSGLTRKDATVEIVEAFAAEMGAQSVTSAKAAAKIKPRGGARKSAPKSARSAKRKTR